MLAKNYAFSKFKVVANASFVEDVLQKRLLQISTFSLIGSIVFSYIIIDYFYIDEYKFAFYIAVILSIAVFLNSIYQLYNNFLNGHSFGKVTRNNSFKMSIVNLIGNFVFIPFSGAIGAAISSAIGMFTYGFFTIKEYNKRV
jgi:O-antigen/teichoic acid export membrane protein